MSEHVEQGTHPCQLDLPELLLVGVDGPGYMKRFTYPIGAGREGPLYPRSGSPVDFKLQVFVLRITKII